jgi:hypothetical protein
MSEEQRLHSELIVKQLSEMLLAKYEKGAIEHKTKLWEHSADNLIDNAIEEVLDLAVFLLTLKGKDNA